MINRLSVLPKWANVVAGALCLAAVVMLGWAVFDLLSGAGPINGLVDLLIAIVLLGAAAGIVFPQRRSSSPLSINLVEPTGDPLDHTENTYNNPLVNPRH